MLGFAIGFIGLGAALIALGIQKRVLWLQRAALGLLVTYFTIALLLLIGEAYFRFVYAESDGLPTLASRNWLARYWQTNTDGYRDIEWTDEQLIGRKTVLILGDSFAAGWGIDNPEQRFGNVLAQQLGDNYAVVNLGKEGASTVVETANLLAYPAATAEVVVLQYYLNDIETAALSIGLNPQLDPTGDMPAWVNESYLANFLYWRLVARFRPQQQGTQTYWDWLYSMYDNATVWSIHAEQLKAFADAVESKGAKLIIVIFPNMLDPTRSVPYVDRVAQAFEAWGYDSANIIKLFDATAAMPLQERIVSERDAHASAAFNRIVGDMLYTRIQAMETAAD
ncbi:MAG: SGNH/GDSL hydrolase family protein [Chloroflexi bacterium]|nr:SGNH/GDSL hydrolase family protein [Chloroflexota bacterium]MCC6891798.1 SGNH/GDSL hydrolase family protein [Anaerolineae bacterium]